MQNRVCTTLVLLSYLVFFTLFLLSTNQYNLLLRFIGNNLVNVILNFHTFVPLTPSLYLTYYIFEINSDSDVIIWTIEASSFVSKTYLGGWRVII